MYTIVNDVRMADLQAMRQIAPERILAMYEEIAVEAGGDFPPRPTSFSRMIEVIIEHVNARLQEEHSAMIS